MRSRSSTSNNVFQSSSELMAELPDNSVGLMVTSPPYNVGKDYDLDLSFDEYLEFLGRVLEETTECLFPGAAWRSMWRTSAESRTYR